MVTEINDFQTTASAGAAADRETPDGDSKHGSDPTELALQILKSCGVGRMLHLGGGQGALVGALLAHGADAHGLDSAATRVDDGNRRFPGRFTQGELTRLPYGDDTFQTLIADGCLEELEPAQVDAALREIQRVTTRFAFLRIRTAATTGSPWPTARGRDWWETRCFEAGFRKHPAYYRLNHYEALAADSDTILIPLEKIPTAALASYPLSALKEERDLHMDMLREGGERSDAHVVRYQWASGFVRHGDCVLDAACGLGYGSYVLKHLSEAASVTGIDGSDYAIDYARKNFCIGNSGLQAECGFLPQALQGFADGCFDIIISFETLEHVAEPQALLREFHRLLAPGGRLIVSVPNDWSDETGEDPNPFHLHVYTWDRLRAELAEQFLPEAAAQQIASGCKIRAENNAWRHRSRRLRSVPLTTAVPPDSEWWLMVAMKDPLASELPYRESVYRYTHPPANLLAFERDYRNPWLVRSLLEFPFRATNPELLASLAKRVIADPANQYLPDHGAALAVLGYQHLNDDDSNAQQTAELLCSIQDFIAREPSSSHLLRWRISLLYLCGLLHKKLGQQAEALASFAELTTIDCAPFSPSLGTKTVDAAYEAGMLSVATGDIERARDLWKTGIREALRLARCPDEEFVGNLDYPQTFPLIVAVEFLDSATRCAKALRWTETTHPRPQERLYDACRENWKSALDERWAAMQKMEKMIRDRDDALAGQKILIDDQVNARATMEWMIQERDKAIAAQTTLIDERVEAMRIMEGMIQERDRTIAAQAALIDERVASMNRMEALITEQAATLQTIATLHQTIEQQRQVIEKLSAALPAKIARGIVKTLRMARFIR